MAHEHDNLSKNKLEMDTLAAVPADLGKLAELSFELTAASLDGSIDELAAGETLNPSDTAVEITSDYLPHGAIVRLTTTDTGDGQTATFAVQGSIDGTTWFALPIAETFPPKSTDNDGKYDDTGAFTVDTEGGTTLLRVIQPGIRTRFVRIHATNVVSTTWVADLIIL